jgi:hypothetical protein
MRGKKAKALRRITGLFCKTKGISFNTEYVEGADAVWGPLPQHKNKLTGKTNGIVDQKEFKRVWDKIPDPRLKGTDPKALLRYAKGRPRLLANCARKEYQILKHNLT